MENNIVLSSIKSQVQKIAPHAKVLLFGSRAYGVPTEESDWDILVLISQPVNRSVKKSIHDVLFPISVQISAFINTLIIQEDDWMNNPSYYSLRQTVAGKMAQL